MFSVDPKDSSATPDAVRSVVKVLLPPGGVSTAQRLIYGMELLNEADDTAEAKQAKTNAAKRWLPAVKASRQTKAVFDGAEIFDVKVQNGHQDYSFESEIDQALLYLKHHDQKDNVLSLDLAMQHGLVESLLGQVR